MLERLHRTAKPFLDDVVRGLSARQKSIPPKYFYDERGSELFDAICDLPEYYPTRTEIGLLSQLAPVLRDSLEEFDHLIEYGSGASRKTRIVLRALRLLKTYVPIDVSEEFLLSVAARLQKDFPKLRVEPLVGDFTGPLTLPMATQSGRRVGFFPGSTIGNLGPKGAAAFLVNARKSLGANSAFLLGADLIKDANVLRAAYNDRAGVTAQFNLNLLSRINRELGGNFDEGAFRHVAIWNAAESRIEMHLVSEQPQTVTLDGRRFSFREGETIHTENSYKFTPERLRELAESTGWRVRNVWTDPQYPFAVALFAAS
jgi:L-histidine N-alpha-methyltransferase